MPTSDWEWVTTPDEERRSKQSWQFTGWFHLLPSPWSQTLSSDQKNVTRDTNGENELSLQSGWLRVLNWLVVELLFLHTERSKLRRFRYLTRMPANLLGEIFWGCPTARRAWNRSRTRRRDLVSQLAWFLVSLLRLVALQPRPRLENGKNDDSFFWCNLKS